MGYAKKGKVEADAVAFMVPHETKDGDTYYKGHLDLGKGKAVSLTMFRQKKDGLKSEWVIQAYKKEYSESKKERAKW